MRALIFAYIIEEVAHTHAQNTPLEWARSDAEAVEQDLLVVYPVNDILVGEIWNRFA